MNGWQHFEKEIPKTLSANRLDFGGSQRK